MKVLKSILASWVDSGIFANQLRCLGVLGKQTKTHRVRITKKQMDILLYCAQRGIDSSRHLEVILNGNS